MLKEKTLYETLCPSKLILFEASNRVLVGKANRALSYGTVELDLSQSSKWCSVFSHDSSVTHFSLLSTPNLNLI